MMVLFKAFSALLSYPSEEMRNALPEILEVIRSSPLVGRREQGALQALIEELEGTETLEAEERYVDLFDRGRSLSLNLFEHLHGQSRDRGAAMVDLKRLYEGAGFQLASSELPDYLPVVLEYLSCRDLDEARDLLADCAHILANIAKSLLARGSNYAAVPQALLVIAGERPVDAGEVARQAAPADSLDRDWVEQPAFAKETLSGRQGMSGS